VRIGQHNAPTLAFYPQAVSVPGEVRERIRAFATHISDGTKSEQAGKRLSLDFNMD